MKFKDFLKESVEKHAVLAFGRMNPITNGHQKLVDTVKSIADRNNATHHIVLSHSTDPDKNPLTGAQKLRHAKRAFPDTNFSVSTKEHPNFLKQAELLHQQGVTNLHMVGGSDRVEEFRNLLHKYNGTHKGALYNFKNIEVHSAGDRDPDAEGVSGISASKMRGFASSNDYKGFKRGVPSTMKDEHAKQMFNDVRKGMGVREEVDLGFEMLLNEGVHDKGIFKAVFMAGGPGSGKDFVMDKTLRGHGMTEINSDKALEYLMDKEKLDKTMPKHQEKRRNDIRSKAKNVTELRHRLAIEGRNGLIINGTGDDHDKISQTKGKLEAMGYDTHMVMVNASDEVSRQRNVERGQRGGRTVPEDVRKQKWDNTQASRSKFAELFKDNYVEYDNSHDLKTADDATKQSKEKELTDIHKRIKKFVGTPPKSNASKEWVAGELQKKDTSPLTDPNASLPHKDSKSAEKSREMGLDYYGHGRYGKEGKVTHRSVHDRLIDMNKFTKANDSKSGAKETTSSSSSSKSKPRTKTPEPIKIDYEKDPQ
jgi:cytidyltransferase-like protein